MPDFFDMDGFPKESGTINDFRATRKLRCDWDDRFDVANQILVGRDHFGELYPYKTSTGARAVRARYEGLGGLQQGSGGLGQYESAIVWIEYETPRSSSERAAGGPSSPGGDFTGIVERFEVTAQQLTLSHEKLVWGPPLNDPNQPEPPFPANPDALKEAEAPAKLIVGMDYVLTRSRLSTVDVDIFRPTGKVNMNDFTLFTFNLHFAPETLLYHGPLVEHAINPRTGRGVFSVTYRLSINGDGWNRFWRTKDQFFHRIFNAPVQPVEGQPPPGQPKAIQVYETADFGRI